LEDHSLLRRVVLGAPPTHIPRSGLVITPNQTAARTLGVRPVTLEGYAQSFLPADSVAPPPLVQRLLREAVLAELQSADAEGVARSLLPVVREFLRAGAHQGEDPPLPRARRVLRVTRRYRDLLAERGLIDTAEILREAAASHPPRVQVSVHGYPRLSEAELLFLDAVSGDGSELLLPYAKEGPFGENLSAAETLAEWGWEVTLEPLSEPWAVRAHTEAYSYPNLEAEVRGVLREVKALRARGVPPSDIVVVARDDDAYGPKVLAVAREYGILVEALYQIPAGATRVGAWLELALRAVGEGLPFEAVAGLLAHTLGPGLGTEQWARARQWHPHGHTAWAEIGADVSPLVWPIQDTRQGWTERVDRLSDVYGLSSKVAAWPREIIALATFRRSVTWLGQPKEESLTREAFLSELGELLHTLTVPAQPARKGVTLHTPLAVYGARFRHVFVLGVAEGVFPAPVKDDPVLDFHERKQLLAHGLHLEGAGERARRELLSFWALLQVPTERLVLSYPRLVGRQASQPSAHIARLFGEGYRPPAAPERLAASPEEARRSFLQREGSGDPVVAHARRAWQVERRRESLAPWDNYDGVTGVSVQPDRTFTVSELNELLRCGFRWWAGRELKLAEAVEGETQQLRGTLFHRALELATARALGAPDLRSAVLAALDDAFVQAEQELSADRLPAWPARRRMYLEQLRDAVAAPDFAAPGSEVLDAERTFSGSWQGFHVTGRVDRIDSTPQGVVLVDYKTAKSVPQPDLQLALYREVAAPALYPEQPVHSAYYFSLSAGERVKAAAMSSWALDRSAEHLGESLSTGHFVPDQQERLCDACPFDLVCRRGSRFSRKGSS
jgi:RecB family exonuclease